MNDEPLPELLEPTSSWFQPTSNTVTLNPSIEARITRSFFGKKLLKKDKHDKPASDTAI